MQIDKPGIYDGVPMASYLADPCPEPSLSAGCLNVLLDESAQHARAQHPRLGGRRSDNTARSDIGSAIHTASLGGDAVVYCPVVNGTKAKNPGETVTAWQSKAAKEWRDQQYREHRIPLLEHQRGKVESVADRVKESIEKAGHAGCLAEQTVVAQIDGVWIKTRPDLVDHDQRVIVDLKSADSAHPSKWIRRVLFGAGYYTSAALYERAMLEVTGERYEYRWLVQEYDHPFAHSWAALGEQAREISEFRVERGLKLWRECLQNDYWPGYDQRIHYADPTAGIVWDYEDQKIKGDI